jgi:perosamine synthetase
MSAVLTEGGPQRRERIQRVLEERHGIETRPFFVAMHRLPMYESGQSLPETEFLSDHGLNFPTYTGLDDRDIEDICGAIADAVRTTAA